jgi:cysteinyl-tRNA synthetase
MLTVNGQKMSKSLGNSFLPGELITGNHALLNQAYSPMSVRFFMLQSHYSSTLDFSNDALKSALKGYKKISNGIKLAKKLSYTPEEGVVFDLKQFDQVNQICENCYESMNDDFNTALTIGHLFNLLKKINLLQTGSLKHAQLGEEGFNKLVNTFILFVEEVLGLKEEKIENSEYLLKVILDFYSEAKSKKDYARVDAIRSMLKGIGIALKDMKDQIDWAYEE